MTDSMQIFCKTITGKTFALDVTSTQTVADLKTKLHEKEGLPTDQIRLVFGGKELQDDRALSDYNIKKMNTVNLLLRLRGGFQIFCKTLTGKTITLEASYIDTIE